jgi:hypothetical protein
MSAIIFRYTDKDVLGYSKTLFPVLSQDCIRFGGLGPRNFVIGYYFSSA